MKELTEEQKQELASMSKPSDMDPSERKRQYSALRRAIIKDANPALVAKFSLASDAERPLICNHFVQRIIYLVKFKAPNHPM